MGKRVELLDRVFQGLGGAELRHLHGGHLDGLTGARVPRGASGSLFGRENAQTSNRNLVALLQTIDDGINYRVDGLLGLHFRAANFLVNGVNEGLFVHKII